MEVSDPEIPGTEDGIQKDQIQKVLNHTFIFVRYTVSQTTIFTESNLWGRVATPVKQGQTRISLRVNLYLMHSYPEEPGWSVCFLKYLSATFQLLQQY